jgi:hypothetical protein
LRFPVVEGLLGADAVGAPDVPEPAHVAGAVETDESAVALLDGDVAGVEGCPLVGNVFVVLGQFQGFEFGEAGPLQMALVGEAADLLVEFLERAEEVEAADQGV